MRIFNPIVSSLKNFHQQWKIYLPFLSLKKIIFYSTFLLALGYGVGFIIYQHLFYLMFTRHYNQRKIASHVWIYRRILGESGRRYSQKYQIKLNWMLKQPTELWHIRNDHNMELHAHFIRNPKATSNIVAVLAHGFRGNPLQLAHFVDFYVNEMGYHVLLPIARGHSSSGGMLITFGYTECEDYVLWLNEVVKEFGAQTNIVLHGVSMGGATVLLTGANHQLPSQVKAIISDSSFSSLQETLVYQFPSALKRISHWMLNATNRRLKAEADFSLEEANLLKQMARIPVPVLLIHGTHDRIVPVTMVNSLYDACPHPKKYKLSVKGAGHAFSWFISPYLYRDTLKNFLESSLYPPVENVPHP